MNPMVMIYVSLIKKHLKTIDDVKPDSLKQDVQAELDKEQNGDQKGD